MGSAHGPILVVGAINTDLVATVHVAPDAGETVTGSSFAIHGGGKGANQAVAVARSGGAACLAGAIGNDAFGVDRVRELASDEIDTSRIVVREEVASGVALIVVEDGGQNRISYVPGATLTVTPDQLETAFAHLRPAIVLVTNEAPPDALRALFINARKAGTPVVFNATPEPEAARDLLPLVSILIVNEGEAAALLGSGPIGDPQSAIGALLQLGPEAVALTLGPEGVIVGADEAVTWHRAPVIDVVDTTGAGDTFCGALVAELGRGASLTDAARYAVLASALSVTKSGAQTSIPTREEVARWQAGVK